MWTASQAALTECYALYPESFNDKSNSCRFTITVNGVTYKKCGPHHKRRTVRDYRKPER